jgi:hypothetical protein
MAEVKPATDEDVLAAKRMIEHRNAAAKIDGPSMHSVPGPDLVERLLARLDAAEKRVKELEEELESTADKLSDCWLFLDAVADGDCLLSPRDNAAKLLRRQAAPGWK